jgi:hypothetical protein
MLKKNYGLLDQGSVAQTPGLKKKRNDLKSLEIIMTGPSLYLVLPNFTTGFSQHKSE